MKCSRFILFFVCLLILGSLTAVSALAESTISVTPIKNQISILEEASFRVEISNPSASRQRYTIYSFQNGQGWVVQPTPLRDKIIEIAPGQSYTTTIVAKPLEDFTPGIYNVHITVESDQGERLSQPLKIYLSSDTPMDYLPSIRVTLDMDDRIDPRESLSVKLFLENRNPLDLSNLQLKVQSEIPEFVTQLPVNIPPLERKTVEFTVVPNPHQQPKEYVVFFVFERDGQPVKVVEKKIEILPLELPFTVEDSVESLFLKQFHELTVTNEGNVLNTQEVMVPVTLWQSLFVAGDAAVDIKDGRRYVIWETTLQPGESTIINYVVNYRLFLYLLAIILIMVGFYLYVQSPLTVKKSVIAARNDEEGALSEIKITIEIKNESGKPVKNVHVIDVVPGIVNVENSLELGTLKPQDVKFTKQGTKVNWSLAELDAHEHRLITYKVKAKLNILGPFSLPRATVEYHKGRRVRKSYSNVCRL